MRRMAALLIVVMSLLGAPGRADEVEELMNALKPSPLDYAAWAGNLLSAVGDLKDSPGAQGRLYEKAYELGMKQAKGYPAAIKAAQALLKARPDQKAAWQQKLLAVYKLDWQAADRKRKKEAGRAYVEQMIAAAADMAASGDLAEAIKLYTDASGMVRYYAPELRGAVAQKLTDVKSGQKLRQELARCKSVLAASPDNTPIRERLIHLLVVEFDDPSEAKKLLTTSVSKPLRTYVPLAAEAVEQARREACLELGDWHRSLAAKATLRGQANVLSKAKAYYARFVELETNSVRRASGKAKLAKVEKELAAVSAPSTKLLLDSAAVAVRGSGFDMADLRDGGTAFSNRTYVWRGVPKDLAGWRYTRTAGGRLPEIVVEVAGDGYLHVAVPVEADTRKALAALRRNGWQLHESLSFSYSDRGRTRMLVIRRKVQAGSEFRIPQIGWAGTLVLKPPG